MPANREQAAALIEAHQPELYRLAYSLTLDSHAAERISAASLLTALRSASSAPGQLPVEVRMARKVVDACRWHAAWMAVKDWTTGLIASLRDAGAGDGPAESGAASYAASGLWPAYQRLSSAGQRVIALRYFQHYPIERIAVLLGSSEAAVRSQLSIARHCLDDAAGGPTGMLGSYTSGGLNHTQARQLLQSAADLPLGGQQWQSVQDHLEACPSCRAYRQRLQSLQRDLGRALQPHLAPARPAGPEAAARILAAWEK